MNNIAIFASGSGTNAQCIMEHFVPVSDTNIKVLLTNKKDAGVVDRAKNMNIPVKTFDREMFYNSTEVVDFLKKANINWIILAGFLWLVPQNILKAFPNRIINIHPALLPKYGGKGMYGINVHKAVIDAKETESGITIHLINEEYDKGDIIFQAKCAVTENDTPKTLANKIHELEHKYFSVVIDTWIKQNNE